MTDIMARLDELQLAIGEVEAISAVTTSSFDRVEWEDAADPLYVERLAYLLGMIAKAATAATGAFNRLHAAIADAQPAPAGERWTDEGTAPGAQAEAMSPQDAEIVRRIRARCPDKRYEGGSDAELIQLFRRNKRVLGRSDEDVIAAMTSPR